MLYRSLVSNLQRPSVASDSLRLGGIKNPLLSFWTPSPSPNLRRANPETHENPETRYCCDDRLNLGSIRRWHSASGAPLCQRSYETREEQTLRVGRGGELHDGTRRRNEIERSPPCCGGEEARRCGPAGPGGFRRRRRGGASRHSKSCRSVEQADECESPGDIGRLLRREGLYSSHLSAWRKAAREGSLRELARKRGPKPSAGKRDVKRLRRLERETRTPA